MSRPSVAATAPPARIAVRSSLRLFLSLDIVGSTEFKQASRGTARERLARLEAGSDVGKRSRDVADAWVEPFLSFYQISVDQMEAQWLRTRDEMRAIDPSNKSGRFAFGAPPQFWKGAGDEVLFSKEVISPLDAMATVHSFLAVMKEHRGRFARKEVPLDVKGTAWLAGFPVNNAEAVLPSQNAAMPAGRLDDPVAENYRLLHLYRADQLAACQLDYVGPSVDLGFRLREHATPRRLVLSADLVWLLCHTHDRCKVQERRKCRFLSIPHVGYDGRRGLKGILGGHPYPLMWIEADPDNLIDQAEDAVLRRALSGHTPARDRIKDVSRFCGLFLNGRTPLQSRPYIEGCSDPEVSAIPAEHRASLQHIESHVNDEVARSSSIGLPEGGSGAIPRAAEAFAMEIATQIASRGKSPASKRRRTEPRR